YVNTDTEAIIQMDDLPGTEIRGKVTRRSPAIDVGDRTMRVEVDLYNDGKENYAKFVARGVANFLAPMGASQPAEIVMINAASRMYWARNVKGYTSSFPLMPRVSGKSLQDFHLLPGMSGYMRLMLQKFQDCYLIPSSAIFTRGGKPYIFEVRSGV